MLRRSALVILFLSLASLSYGETRQIAASGLAAIVNSATGEYELRRDAVKWRLVGTLADELKNVSEDTGADRLGAYRELRFDLGASRLLSASVRLYERAPLALFSVTTHSAQPKPPPSFPSFTSVPSDLHVFSYADNH